MNFTKLHKTLLAIVGVIALVLLACNSFDNINQPEEAYLNEEVTITARLKIEPGTNDTATLLFAMYAPKSLDLANNAHLVFSTENFAAVLGADYGVVDIKNETLTPVPASEKAPHSPYTNGGGVTEDQWLVWSEALLNYYGQGDNETLANAPEMEWVAWESKTPIFISDKLPGDVKHNQTLYANVTITFNAGSRELECYLGYAYCNKTKGFYHDQEHLSEGVFKKFEIAYKAFESVTIAPETIIFSDGEPVDVKATAKFGINSAVERDAQVVFGVYAPKSLKLAENATALFSTTNYTTDVVNETLKVVSNETVGDGTWAEAFAKAYGVGGNEDLETVPEMEWVVWQSDNILNITGDLVGTPLYGEVVIDGDSGLESVDCYMGIAYCDKTIGFSESEITTFGSKFMHFVVEEYIKPAFPSLEMIQSAYRYGDIFGMVFSADDTELEGETNIYICGKALYDGGQVAEVTTAVEANRLVPFVETLPNGSTRNLYEKYVYLPHLFNLPSGAKIEEVTVWFINADGSKKATTCVKSGEPFLIEQTPGSIHDVEEPEGDDTTEDGDDENTEQ